MLAARRLEEAQRLPDAQSPGLGGIPLPAPLPRREKLARATRVRRLVGRYLAVFGSFLILAVVVTARTVALEASNYRLDQLNQTLAAARAQQQTLSMELAQQAAVGHLLKQGAAMGLVLPSQVIPINTKN